MKPILHNHGIGTGPAANCDPESLGRELGVIQFSDQLVYRTARSRQDFEGAFRLLQHRYFDAGLASPSDIGVRFFPYHLASETQVFVAVQRAQVIGSVSLVRNGKSEGIPMESTYPYAVSKLRQEGRIFGEACSLTVKSPNNLSTGEVFNQLTRLMMFYARRAGLDHLIAVVHPRHAKFYKLAMGFRTIGELTPYHQAGGQPGIPVLGSVIDPSSYKTRWRKFYFDDNFSEDELKPRPMNPVDRLYFQSLLAPNASAAARNAA